MNKEWRKLEEVIPFILQEAKRLGATAAEAAGVSTTGLSTTVRLGKTETVEFNQDKKLAITVYKGQKKGSAATTDIHPAAIAATLTAALGIADYTEEDPFSGLADQALLAQEIPALDLYHPWEHSPEQAILIAKECEESARSFDSRITNSEGATLATHTSFRIYGNTEGFLGSYPTTRFSLSVGVIAKEKELMQREYDFTVARNFNELRPGVEVGRKAAERTVKRLHARKIKTCEVPVIFAAEIAGSLFSHFIGAISGSSLYRKASFLVDSLGKPIFPSFMNITEDPHLLRGLASAPFDQEGVATQKRLIVHEGILQGYVLSSYSARKLGLQSTGNSGGIHNLLISPTHGDLIDLLKEMQRGLLVTELMGHGINLVTGDYSNGAFGFWVENGEIQYPVQEITIAGNLKTLFRTMVAVGNDLEKRGTIQTGSILLENMMVAGL
jgi:PmbA protein